MSFEQLPDALRQLYASLRVAAEIGGYSNNDVRALQRLLDFQGLAACETLEAGIHKVRDNGSNFDSSDFVPHVIAAMRKTLNNKGSDIGDEEGMAALLHLLARAVTIDWSRLRPYERAVLQVSQDDLSAAEEAMFDGTYDPPLLAQIAFVHLRAASA